MINAVEVTVSDAAGAPVAVPAGALSVEVGYGSSTKTLPLVPDGEPGELRAPIVPTRPGTYAFHVSGAVRGRPLDVGAACSEATFECVEESAAIEFPAQDPSTGELADRLSRESDRVGQAQESADSAKRTATIALALAVVVILGAAAMAVARRRGSSRS
jgi:hypothetical protein